MNTMMMSLQKLSIELYFNKDLVKYLINDPESLANQYSIDKHYIQMLPDVKCDSFKTESSGRKILITKEITKRFANFFCLYFKTKKSVSEIANEQIMNNFFKSYFFLTENYSFPHYSGVGQGYDTSSKFFLYIINEIEINQNVQFGSKDTRNKLLLQLYSEMSFLLKILAPLSDISFYSQFSNAIFFKINNSNYLLMDNKLIEIDSSCIPIGKTSLNNIAYNIINTNKRTFNE